MHLIKDGFAGGSADERLDVTVARAHRPCQACEPGIGLDRHAVPSLQVEGERGVVVNRMAGADVEIKAVALLAEAAHQIKVFVALGVGDERHGHGYFLKMR